MVTYITHYQNKSNFTLFSQVLCQSCVSLNQMSSSSTADTFSGIRQDSSAILEQNSVHAGSFCLHVHDRVPKADFLQLHAVSSMSPFGAGSLFMSTVSMSLSLAYHPLPDTEGRFCLGCRHLTQTMLWKLTGFKCMVKLSCVGGKFSLV